MPSPVYIICKKSVSYCYISRNSLYYSVFHLNEIIEFICFLFAVTYLSSPKVGYWRNIVWFMLLTLTIEIVATIISSVLKTSNHWLYNLYLPVDFIFKIYMFYKIYPKISYSRFIYYSTLALYISFYLAESTARGFLTYNNISDTFASFLLVVACNGYYYLLLIEERWINILKHAPFWFVTGVFIYNFCSIATNLFSTQLMDLYISKNLSLRYILFVVFNLILYGTWSYSFVCRSQEKIS
jgi:hypothetical protein